MFSPLRAEWGAKRLAARILRWAKGSSKGQKAKHQRQSTGSRRHQAKLLINKSGARLTGTIDKSERHKWELKDAIGNNEKHNWELKGRGRSIAGDHRRHVLEKVPLGSSRRVEGRPHSAAEPLSITNTMSQSMMVCSLQTCTDRLSHVEIVHRHRLSWQTV